MALNLHFYVYVLCLNSVFTRPPFRNETENKKEVIVLEGIGEFYFDTVVNVLYSFVFNSRT